MSGHTKGPWVVIAPDPERPSRATVCAIIGVNIYDAPLTDETAANARLIAACPNLLAACKAVVATFSPENLPNLCDYERRLRDICSAAIAKAETSP